MCIEARFLRNQRVILYEYSDPLDLNKAAAVLAQHRHYYAEAAQPIHRIVDGTHVTRIPDGFLSALLHNTNLHQPNSGVTIVIVNQPFLRIMADLVSRAMRSVDIRIVSTMTDALAEIDSVLAQEARTAENESRVPAIV